MPIRYIRYEGEGKKFACRESFGDTLIVDPWGKVISRASNVPGLITARLDLSYLRKIRQSMPVESHRRGDVYCSSKSSLGSASI
mmetsp:Transcript_11067/g.20336  ORF Transcript_11067/g.20336 Transcript_11067/m.20336 type:complete len:84 (-) Transcript_11067:192-443(-)